MSGRREGRLCLENSPNPTRRPRRATTNVPEPVGSKTLAGRVRSKTTILPEPSRKDSAYRSDSRRARFDLRKSQSKFPTVYTKRPRLNRHIKPARKRLVCHPSGIQNDLLFVSLSVYSTGDAAPKIGSPPSYDTVEFNRHASSSRTDGTPNRQEKSSFC